uniref:zinc finger protein 831 n=1 Tax=Semicossyphus pulcher TaxID=241346 RepID=UPI0037E93C87
METGKPGLANALVHSNSVAAQAERRMDIQAPLTAVYIHTGPTLPAQPYPQPAAATRPPATLHLAMPPLYSKETLPFLTFHIAGGLQSQPGLSLAAPAIRPKSAGKHVCPHCGRDCMKPSVLEKHLRCHTGERPYPCTTCGVSFKTQSNLYKHKRTQAHARLSSESEQSSLGSMDSMSSSRETCTSSMSLDEHSEESGSMGKEATLPAAEIACSASTAKVISVQTQSSLSEQNELTPADHKTELNESTKVTIEEEKQRMENEKPPLTASRHLPLQRQEATLFSKQWESSVSRGKSQSHESTDSGFSESSDHYPSPGSVLLDHSMDSLTESTKEHVEETSNAQTLTKQGQSGQDANDTSRQQEQKKLEERISKLISENSAVVEDKQLENVRPRKTVLSKQGSIDLPMPYTYKDSFHFDMRISKTPNVGLQGNRNHGLYSSVPTQHSTTTDHAPLTRSNSLPFSVTLMQPEKGSQTSSYQSDYVTLIRRGSSGQINPTGFAMKPVNQQSSTHRPLVRQTAVDCNHATDCLFMNSSVEEAYTGSLSCDGDGSDICGEPSNRKFRRKKAQKFAYNKWYMYGGGTFRKLYNAEKGGDESFIKGRKSSTHPEHEVQGLQKRLSAVHKETVTTTGSTINFTSATAGHPGCPPAKLSLVSAPDFNQKTSKLPTSCNSLKTPLHRNLSLSVLPLPSIGSLVSHKIEGISKAEAGRLVNVEKQSDSSSQLSGAHIPSDRKKQKTDDKIICPLEMETDPNTLTHPPPSVTGSAPQQDTNLTYISLQQNQKHTPLKGVLFQPRIINANTPSVSTSSATSTHFPAKTSFLPKYQLKLPNAAEPDSNPSPHIVDKPTGMDCHNVTSAPPSSHTEQATPLVTSFERKSSDPVTSVLMQGCDIKKSSSLDTSSTPGQLCMPCIATTLCQAEILRLKQHVTSSVAVEHRQFAETMITTTCLQNNQTGLCSTLIQPSKPAGASASVQLTRPVPPMLMNFPAASTVTTANSQISPSAITALSQGHPSHPLPHTHALHASDQSSPVNKAFASSNTPIVPCHIVPFDKMQPANQNVFHVHTADLQICLQIISDEQLALIEPQIERQTGSTLSHRRDVEAVAPEVTQNKAQNSASGESSNEERDHQQPGHGKESDKSKSLPTLNMDRMKPSPSVQLQKVESNLHLTEHSDSTQAEVSAESKPPKALDSLQRPHNSVLVNMVTETQSCTGDVMSIAASFEGAKSERSHISETEHAVSLNRCAEEQLLQDTRVSHGGLISRQLSGQDKLSMTSLSHSTVNQKSMPSGIQHKLKCNIGTMKAKSEASAYNSSKLESSETHHPQQVGLTQASSATSADELSGSVSSFSIKTSGQLNPPGSTYCSNQVESTSEALNASKHANMGCERVGLIEDSASAQEMSLNESKDEISSAHSQNQLGQFSSNIKMEKLKDNPAVLTGIQSPTPEPMDGASLAGSAAQEELQTQRHGETSDSADWRPKQRQEVEETNHRCLEGEGGGGMAGEDMSREIEKDEQPDEPGEAESDCRYMCLQDVTKPEEDDREVKVDSSNSWLPEQHLQDLSQTHSGMSEYPSQSPQRASSMSNHLNFSASCSQTRHFNHPQTKLETNNFYFSQQQHWDSSVIHNQQTHNLCMSNVQLTETQNAFSQIESGPIQTQTFSHQDQKQTSITASLQQGNTTAGNNITEARCCTKLTLGSQKCLSLEVKSSSSTHTSQVFHSAQVTTATPGSTGDSQASNNNVLDNNPVLPSTHPVPEDYQDAKDRVTNDYMGQSSNSERSDMTSKYQSFFLAGQLHGFPPAECLTSGVRPVQTCQDYTEDTSSSDDEGKLIIEL